MKHEGDLIIKKEDVTDYSRLTSIDGNLLICSNVELPNLKLVSGYLSICSNVEFELPNLKEVGGHLHISSNVELDAPNLKLVVGGLYVYSNVELPNLTSVGTLHIYSNVELDAPNLKLVVGGLYVYSNVELPNLTSVGTLHIYSNAKLDAPNLISVSSYLSIYSDDKLDAPFLKDLKWKSIDRCLFVIESTKIKGGTTIYKGYNVENIKDNVIAKEKCYVAEQGTFYAHGKTIKKAIEDLNFKIISDKIKKEPIDKDTLIDIKYYRMVTGACEMGIKSFIKGNKLKKKYTAEELLPILEKTDAYGLSKFKELLTF